MLGYRFVLHRMYCVNQHSWAEAHAALRRFLHSTVLLGAALSLFSFNAVAQRISQVSKDEVAELSCSGPQRHQGDVTSADDNCDLRYGETRLHADHVEYNEKTKEAV